MLIDPKFEKNIRKGYESGFEKSEKYFSISETGRILRIPIVLVSKMIKWGLIGATLAVDGTIKISESEIIKTKEFLAHPWRKAKLYWKSLGPGLVTGASDDDPGGIATYSSIGAKFGLSLVWMALWMLPMMLAIQETCARIGIVTNKGLTEVLAKHYKKYFVFGVILLLVFANVVNIGADIGAMAASFVLLVPIKFIYAAIGFAVAIILLEIFVPYQKYFQILKWLSVILFVYVITVIIIQPDWMLVIKSAINPKIEFSKEYIFAMVAFFGTTITPYLFFWQTSEEVEDGKLESCSASELHKPKKVFKRIVAMRNDVKTGMIFSNLIAIFIIITAAEVLFKNGITNIETAEQAAQALRPLAGNHAYFLFALGIIGMGFMAVPVLAGSCAYAISEMFGWKEGLGYKFSQAKSFYVVIALAVIIGFLFNFIGINPIVALYYSAWINGVISLPLIAVIMTVGGSKKIMGESTNPLWVRIFGWMAVLVIGAGLVTTILLNWGPLAK